MAIHMSIGLLFLGGGMYTLSTSNEAVAALLCAFYPLFPCHMSDNRLHLQGKVLTGSVNIEECHDNVSFYSCSVKTFVCACCGGPYCNHS